MFSVLWVCRYARSHPEEWAAWKADPSSPIFLKKFNPGPILNFSKEIAQAPDPAHLFLVLYLGESLNIFNLSDEKKGAT